MYYDCVYRGGGYNIYLSIYLLNCCKSLLDEIKSYLFLKSYFWLFKT